MTKRNQKRDKDRAVSGRLPAGWALCRQCGKPMNPIDVMLGPVCTKCCRENQKKMTEGKA